MPRKSLKACPTGINKARIALTGKGWSYEKLAEKVGLSTRQPIGNFFAGKGVASDNFVKICQVLELDWQEIAGLNLPESVDVPNNQPPEPAKEKQDNSVDIDVLVQEVRKSVKSSIHQQCGTMRVLDMTHPIKLGDIYTDVNILEKITGRRSLEINELMQDFDPESENFDRCGLGRAEKRVPGIEAVKNHPKLMVLGKPGAGKTTFLKYLALQCICGEFLDNRVPIFISLKQFAENSETPDLLKFITQAWTAYGVNEHQIINLLKTGKLLILLDGLDEVREKDSYQVIKHICDLTDKFSYSKYLKEDIDNFNGFLLSKISELPGKEYLKWLKSFFEDSKIINKITNLFQEGCANFLKTTLLEKLQVFSEKEYLELFRDYPKRYDLTSLKEDINTFNKLLSSKITELSCEEYLKWLYNEYSDKYKIINKIKLLIPVIFEADPTNFLKKTLSDKFQFFSEDEYLELFHDKSPTKTYMNYFVITCRIAAREEKLEKFTEVEVADFDNPQIEAFVKKWYQGQEPNPTELFMQQMKFNQPIKELATNPLLLTLLCLVFRVTGDFPSNRSDLYKEGVAVLLKKWDGERLIKRDLVYKNLSPQRKEDLLSQIALTTFKRGDYFFKQGEIERHIADYIRHLPDAQTDQKTLLLDSGAVLKSIEAQHGLLVERARGIYSFSHLTFQEYFTARKIVTTSNPKALEEALQGLASHITDKRWQEVLSLALGLLPSADRLLQLMKQYVDALVATDEKLQQFLVYLDQKSSSVKIPSYKPAAVRAFYFSFALDIERDLANTLDMPNSLNHVSELALDRTLKKALKLALSLNCNSERGHARNLELVNTLYRCCGYSCDLNPNLERHLRELKRQLPVFDDNEENFKQWWKADGKAWAEQLTKAMIKYRNIHYDWQFSNEQKQVLHQYYNKNISLVTWQKQDCYISREVRQQIEDTLLLPVKRLPLTSN